MPGSALHLSLPAGWSLSSWFPLLLLLLPAGAGEPSPGRQSPTPCVPGLAPLPPFRASRSASPFCSWRQEEGGEGAQSVDGMGL